ncbi:MAG: peptidyl-prolyl cis-trans isomerase [Candidatus Goldbacteria bacterium]|nr:peptidyl-prolyl cis-trans isomerase [Candidatus Goldiibacteriota bacterium]
MKIIKSLIAFLFFCIFISCETTSTVIKEDVPFKEVSEKETAASDKIQGEISEQTEDVIKFPTAKLEKDIVAVIGKYTLTKEKLRIIKEYMQEKYDVKLDPDQETEFLEYLINRKLMALEAREKGYAERNDVKIKYEWDFDDIISHDFYKENIEKKSKVSTAEARDYYNKNKSDFVEIKAQHILIKNKDLARNVYKKIMGGENFDDMAKKYSEDEVTKSAGGNLGYFTKGVMVKEFEDVAFSLGKDQVSEPVKTIYGYHIIKVLDRRPISFEESKDKIINMIQNKKLKNNFESMLKQLKSKYKVVVNEEYKK